ncbi:hypothetical protein GCM10009826_47610 [Humibacillus xanthopallidus]
MSEVWSAMASAAWVANTGVPLLATVAGLAVAVILVRRQLGSDRQLRLADRRQEAAARLGVSLSQALLKLRQTPKEDKWWENPSWPDEQNIRLEVGEASILLSDSRLAEVASLVDDLSAAWQVSLVTAHRMTPHPDIASHKAGVLRAVEPYSSALEHMSISLRVWDGMDSMPQSLSDVEHVATTYDKGFTTDATKSWRGEREAAYLGRGVGLMLTKPDKRRLWDDEGRKDGRA